jgi:prolyl 4-hydroxylase
MIEMLKPNRHESFIGQGWISPKLCDELIYNFENKYYKQPGAIGDGVKEDFKKSTDAHLDNMDNEIPEYTGELSNIINTYISKYSPYMTDISPYGFIEGCNIQRYSPGEGFYEYHHERGGPGILTNRVLVWMTYLNNVEDGGTEFLYQGIKTEAKKGLTLIWPTDFTHVHRGIISNSRTKYIITGWLSWINNE